MYIHNCFLNTCLKWRETSGQNLNKAAFNKWNKFQMLGAKIQDFM